MNKEKSENRILVILSLLILILITLPITTIWTIINIKDYFLQETPINWYSIIGLIVNTYLIIGISTILWELMDLYKQSRPFD